MRGDRFRWMSHGVWMTAALAMSVVPTGCRQDGADGEAEVGGGSISSSDSAGMTSGESPATTGATTLPEGSEGPAGSTGPGETGSASDSGGAEMPLDDEFEDGLSRWQQLNEGQAQTQITDGRLHIVPTANSLWFNASSGVLVHQPVDGDFIATVDLTARGVANPDSPPPAEFRVAGLMARNPDTSSGENYVFVALGADYMPEALETKTTINSVSEFVETPWPGAEGELRICRVGSRFELLVRERGGQWMSADVYERSDLPGQLQVGMFAFSSNANPDMQAWFDWIRFEVPGSTGDCAQ